ncbi:serine/threonine-protein kinase, partial [Actinomadura rubrisoli]|uniref:serine/threonine-protein kinase n=1 Tax=Actinomadura rubrisoli TaxID=2530368 RepID=UPI001405527F
MSDAEAGAFSTDPERIDTLPPTAAASSASPLGSLYLLEHVIGSGATGRVWQGRRRADDALLAVKVLRGEFADDMDAVTRFLRQKTVLRGLAHPHLVRVRDLVAEGDVLAIVMDLVDGDDLRRVLAAGTLRPDQFLTVLGQAAGALAAVHAAGVTHRDIKPENVLVTRRGAEPFALLTDFGLAGIADGAVLTRASQLVGTPAYIAPEAVAGRPAGPAADVYALGVTLYEALAGRRPFHAPNP